MQTRLTLKHLSGSRANQEDTIALTSAREIVLGRDPECEVQYGETDDLVSRKHLKIVAIDEQPARYMVVDLGSRNGTFLNRQRVFGSALLSPGGHVQLGAGGPEFEFTLAGEQAKSAPVPCRGTIPQTKARAVVRGFIKATLIVLVFATGAAAGYTAWIRLAPLWRNWRSEQAAREAKAKFIRAAVLASVTRVDVEWSLFDKQTGAGLARAYIANERFSRTALVPLLEGAPAILPAFVLGANRRIEPLLVPTGSAHAGKAIGGAWSASGFIVAEHGAVLTAAPTRLPWDRAWQWAGEETAGVLLVPGSSNVMQMAPLASSQFPSWVPAESGFLAESLSQNLQEPVHGRSVSRADLRVAITAKIIDSGRALETNLSAQSSPIWVATLAHGAAALSSAQRAPLDRSPLPTKGQSVWIVGREIETGKIQDVTADGRIELPGSHCGEGAVVFDQSGFVLALCIPDAHSRNEVAGVLLKRAADGYAARP
jgi:FHA domain